MNLWKQAASELIRKVDPNGIPPVLIAKSELPREHPLMNDRWNGFALSYRTMLADGLESFVPAVAHAILIRDEHADNSALILHEYAHVAEFDPPARPAAPVATKAPEKSRLELVWGTYQNQLPFSNGHGSDFIKACVHVAYRAKRAGQPVAAELIVDPTGGNNAMWVAHKPPEYQLALGVDPAATYHLPLAEALKIEPCRLYKEMASFDAIVARNALEMILAKNPRFLIDVWPSDPATR